MKITNSSLQSQLYSLSNRFGNPFNDNLLIQTNPNGRSFDVQTGDRQVVTVNLRQPLNDMLEGLVEVHGVSQGKGLILCDNFINFPPELADSFGKLFYFYKVIQILFKFLSFLSLITGMINSTCVQG